MNQAVAEAEAAKERKAAQQEAAKALKLPNYSQFIHIPTLLGQADAEWDRRIREASTESKKHHKAPYRGLSGLGGTDRRVNPYTEAEEHEERLRRLEIEMETRLAAMHKSMVVQKESYEGRLRGLEEQLAVQSAVAQNATLWRKLDF